MEENKEIILSPVKEEDRLGDGNLKPEKKQEIVLAIEEYINKNKKININEIARMLDMKWDAVNSYVGEITDKWREEDKKKVEKWRNVVFGLFEGLITDTIKTLDNVNIAEVDKFTKIHDIKKLFTELKELGSFGDTKIDSATDSSRMIAVHFNNLSLSPSMERELKKVREEKT